MKFNQDVYFGHYTVTEVQNNGRLHFYEGNMIHIFKLDNITAFKNYS